MQDEEDTLFLPQANGNVAKIMLSLSRMAMKNNLFASENKMLLNHENSLRSIAHEAFLIQT